MADEIDIANDRAAMDLERALAAARGIPGPEATGCCLWCEEPVAEGRRWCNAACRDDWEAAR